MQTKDDTPKPEDPPQTKDGGGLNGATCSRYIPSRMRDQETPSPREVTYAIGTENSPGEFGMKHDPNPDEQCMLEQAGTTLNDVIIRFNADWTDDVLWRWDGGGWVLQSFANAGAMA